MWKRVSILHGACTRVRGTPCVSAPARACAGAGARASDPGCGCEAGVSGTRVGVCGVWASVKVTCSRGVSRAQRRRKRPGINGLLIDSSYITFFPSGAYKPHAPCKNRI